MQRKPTCRKGKTATTSAKYNNRSQTSVDSKLKLIDRLIKYFEKLSLDMRTLRSEITSNEDTNCINSRIVSIENKLINVFNISNELFINVAKRPGIRGIDLSMKGIEFVRKKVPNFERNEDIIRIKFPTLLRREDKTGHTGYKTSYNLAKALYEVPFADFFGSAGGKIYGKKVVICFRHYFTDPRGIMDADNMYIKPVIDMIKDYTLIDDSMEYVSLYQEGIIGKTNHTTVWVIPAELFAEAIETRFRCMEKYGFRRKKKGS